eukprot:COSAG02_NODE_248_length_27133_cov_45.131723_19_plen_46_part_00
MGEWWSAVHLRCIYTLSPPTTHRLSQIKIDGVTPGIRPLCPVSFC